MIQAWENSKEDSLKLVSLFDPNDLDKPLKIYFKLLRCSNLKSIDPILDFLNSLRLKELDLLNDHTNRVNEALENEFCVTIPGIKVKRKHVKKYEPQLTSLFESIENHIEATGKMPESTLHVDSPLPKTTDIPTFVFYKNDEHWKIGRKGEKHYSVDHRKCMYYIYILVNYPDVDFFSVDLCNRVEDLIAAEKKGVDNYTTLKTLEADGLLHQFKPPPFIRTNYNHKSGDNEKSRRQKIKNEITELDKKKEKLQLDLEGDALTISPEKVMETKEEIKEIDEQKSERKKYLNSLPKRIDLDPRDPSSQLEKNRIKALKNITTAADILKGFPSVNEYVGEETTRFKTGKRCQYKPSPKKPVEWITNPKDPRLV